MESFPLPPLTVILIEDNLLDVRFIRWVLEAQAFPYVLQVLTNGDDALGVFDQLAAQVPLRSRTIVLLDLTLPQRDGIELLRRLKGLPHGADIPVVIVTSSADSQDRAETLALGPRKLLDERARRQRTRGLTTDAGREEARLELAQFHELQRRLRSSIDDVRHRLEGRQLTMPSRAALTSIGNLPELALPHVHRQRAALGEFAGRVASTGRALTNREPTSEAQRDDST